MEFEVLKRSHIKRNIILGVVTILIISAVILNFTKAKYRTTQSIPLVSGTINYNLADLNIVAITIDGEESDMLPIGHYELLDTSYCEINGEKSDVIISWDTELQTLSIAPFTNKGTKCYLNFEEKVISVRDTLLANYQTQLTRTDFRITVTDTTTGTIYYADTSKGRTYYFAGNPIDNWVKFGGFYWRIIRINEDGTIRIIYQGTSANATGTETQIGTSAFNSSYNDNMYVGYMYQSNEVHGFSSNSTIKEILDEWYQNNLTSVADKIDGNAGFCGDRTPSTSSSTSNGQGGFGKMTSYYGFVRLWGNDSGVPTMECSTSDLYTVRGSLQGNESLIYPIGLISMDEVWYAGGYQTANSAFYLYTNQNYWTMSPFFFDSSKAYTLRVYSNGQILGINVDDSNGIRPVINLKADVTISSGDGTISSPYIVN